MIVQAYAKINLALKVLDKREDGYHNIDILTIPLELHDTLEVVEIPFNAQTYLTCDDPTIVCDENNLAYIALNKMKQKYSNELKRNYHIHIYKRIPTEAGLGGGSADAAAIITVLCKILKIDPHSPEIIELASSIGSDVPYCLFNTPCRIKGVGETVCPIELKKSYYVLLVKPQKGLSTKKVYQKYDEEEKKCECNCIEKLECCLTTDEPLDDNYLVNALQQPAISLLQDVDDILNKMDEVGLKLNAMSGSGSACFALHEDKHVLENKIEMFEKLGYECYLTSFKDHKQFLKNVENKKKLQIKEQKKQIKIQKRENKSSQNKKK